MKKPFAVKLKQNLCLETVEAPIYNLSRWNMVNAGGGIIWKRLRSVLHIQVTGFVLNDVSSKIFWRALDAVAELVQEEVFHQPVKRDP